MANPSRNQNAAPTPNATKPAPAARKRTFTGKVEGLTDLFRLKAADVIKHDSGATVDAHPESHANEFTTWPHSHPYRTYDKSGKALDYCTPIGGHFHIIKTKPSTNKDEPPEIIEVSGPMVMSWKVIKGKKVQVPVPANEYDDHTHEVEYVRSVKFETSSANFEAAAVIAMEANKTAPVQGVQTND